MNIDDIVESKEWWEITSERALWLGFALVILSLFVIAIGWTSWAQNSKSTVEDFGRSISAGVWIFVSGCLCLLIGSVARFVLALKKKHKVESEYG